MRVFSIPIVFAAALAGASAIAQGAAGWIAPPLAGFKVGFQQEANDQMIVEEVPVAESVEDWSRMVTTQRFVVPPGVTPVGFAQGMATNLPRSCPGARIGTITAATLSGLAAVRFDVFCPMVRSTGKPESFWLLAVRDGPYLHVKQAAFRGQPSEDLRQWASGFIDSLRYEAAGG